MWQSFDDDHHRLMRNFRFAGVALALFAVLAGAGIAADWWIRGPESLSTRARTSQFYGFLEAEPRSDYTNVLAIGHGSGESQFTMRRALSHGADVIEIDVAWQHGRLIAAHDSPTGLTATFFRGMSLEQAWRYAEDARLIQFDLKETSPRYVDLVFAFLEAHIDEHAVMVTTREPDILRQLETSYPDVLRFLSIGTRAQLDALVADPELADLLDGVSIRHSLLTEETIEPLLRWELVVCAWTVNNLQRVNTLVDLGVKGITTDNLAILQTIRANREVDAILVPLFGNDDPELGYA
jgi:glycerophosphoryl diester phosphodiesterase